MAKKYEKMNLEEKMTHIFFLLEAFTEDYRWATIDGEGETSVNISLRSLEGTVKALREINTQRMNRMGQDLTALATAGHIIHSFRD